MEDRGDMSMDLKRGSGENTCFVVFYFRLFGFFSLLGKEKENTLALSDPSHVYLSPSVRSVGIAIVVGGSQ